MFVKGILHSCKVLSLHLDYKEPLSVSLLIYVSDGEDLLQIDLSSMVAETYCIWISMDQCLPSMAAQVKQPFR